jgi:predicted nucleotidyltransferase
MSFSENKVNINEVIMNMVDCLVDKYSPTKIILFGSYAEGNPTQDSDIDLLIVKDTEERFIDRWCMVHEILSGTHPSIPIDTLVLTPKELEKRLFIGDQFIANIIENGRVLYAA